MEELAGRASERRASRAFQSAGRRQRSQVRVFRTAAARVELLAPGVIRSAVGQLLTSLRRRRLRSLVRILGKVEWLAGTNL